MKFSELTTEQINQETRELDLCSTEELMMLLQRENGKVAPAVEKVLPEIGKAVDAAAKGMRAGGRLIYVGAGTSGRLGVLDASECPPTFGTDPGRVVGVIAGGDRALRTAVEKAEDGAEEGAADMDLLAVGENDTVVGITASGRTPYVMGAVRRARELGAVTVALCNTLPGEVSAETDIAIVPVVGPEPILGSTRMKAGTAQKMVLNMLSTAVMVKLGKVYGNFSVDLIPTNDKLYDRTVRIVTQAADVSREEAEETLALAGGSAKTAIVMLLCRCGKDTALSLLEKGESVREAVCRYRSGG